MKKLTDKKTAAKVVLSGQTIMVGGFLAVGAPETVLDAVVASNVKDLTIICNDTAWVDKGVGKLVVADAVKKAITSHVGTNPVTGKKMNAGEIEVDLVPQGTLAEQIRCGGAGLGGILTPTGLGTEIEKGKEKIEVDGKTYLLETPLRADVAIIKAWKADEQGNLVYRYSARNMNPLMAMAADTVIAEVEEIVPVGELDPDEIITSGALISMVVRTEGGNSDE